MPRRRGGSSVHQQNSTGRRALTEDGRCNGNNKKPITPTPPRSLKVVEDLPGTSTGREDSMARATLEDVATAALTSQTGDLGYMHKKFKKVAPTFLVQQNDAPPANPTPPAAAPAAEEQPNTKVKEDDGKPGATKGGRYVCPYCQHACAKPSVLEKHIRAHTNERPYPCVPCGFAFKTKSNLYKHCKSRTHVLKLEETGTAAGVVEPPEVGSDDTSDDNVNDQALMEDSDEGEQLAAPLPLATTPIPSTDVAVSSSPEKFKTPYKPKFHNLKPSDEVPPADLPLDPPQPPPPAPQVAAMDVVPPGNRPSPGFLQERISQIISKNQAIVETRDPIWSRRYVRQSSRDKEPGAPKGVSGSRPDVLPSSPHKKSLNRERSSSLNDPSSSGESQLPVLNAPVPPAVKALQEADESQRKRCYSEGPVDNLLRHSVMNLLHQPSQPKQPRTEPSIPVISTNTEGSIIKDILLKSRGLLPTDSSGKDAADPPKMSSSFSVRALLNPSSFSRPKPANEPAASSGAPDPSADDGSAERPVKKARTSPDLTFVSRPVDREPASSSAQLSATSYALREDSQQRNQMRAPLPPFGGEVEVHDGHQRTVVRIPDPAARFDGDLAGLSHRSNGLIHTHVLTAVTSSVVTTKSNLSSSGGIVQVQHRESRVSVFPFKSLSAAGPLFSDNSSTVPTDSMTKSVVSLCRSTSSPPPGLPYIPGIPGPYSSAGWLPSSTTSTYTSYSNSNSGASCRSSVSNTTSSTTISSIPLIAVHPPVQSADDEGIGRDDEGGTPSGSGGKFLRPNSLSLQPGTFNMKKANMAGVDPSSGLPNMLCVSGPGGTLISPETPRPRKLIRQLYLNGHAYTYLGLKCSTRVYFCCLSRAQPMYVLQQCHPKLSMYSQWKTREPASDLEASSPVHVMSLYDSRQRPLSFTTAQSSDSTRMILTHSSYWTNRDRPTSTHFKLEVVDDTSAAAAPSLNAFTQESQKEVSTGLSQVTEGFQPVDAQPTATSGTTPVATSAPAGTTPSATPAQPKRVRIFAGGYKSTEEYTYVRGRGRGRYVCEECGIRCKKPSMLKKHIRTHTDLRPYTCRQCNFSFKTKGNLTKHMKSKAHHKKCTELGIVPVPTSVDDANIDEDSLARQESLKKMKLASGGSGNEGDSDMEDDDDEEDDEDEDDDGEGEGEEEEDDTEEDPHPPTSVGGLPAATPVSQARVNSGGQFEDAVEERVAQTVRGEREQEVARSLLDLGVMAPAGSKPTTYPYASHSHPVDTTQLPATPQKQPPCMPSVTAELPRLKEEQVPALPSTTAAAISPPPLGIKTPQPIDLSTLRTSPAGPHSTAELVASMYSQKAAKEAAMHRKSSASPVDSDSIAQPATSGMLQAYLTDKALKDGHMKRHQVKVATTSTYVGESKGPISILHPSINQHAERDAQPSIPRVHLAQHPSDSAQKIRPEFVVPLSSSSMAVSSASSSASAQVAYRLTDDGKTACSICNKVFTKPSQLRLHINIHYFERPFRCEACAVSFRTKGHLQKHKRSVTHFNKVNMNLTFGTPSTENPRPFKCSDCMIAFRIHGHLAKHLRSKMHIMKLECLGKLPFGTYAEMERSGVNLNEIDTTDCHNSLESLQSLAHRLYKQDPSKLQQWQQQEGQTSESSPRERTISCSSEEFSDVADEGDDMDEDGDNRSEDSDGLPDAVNDTIPPQDKVMEGPTQGADAPVDATTMRSEDLVAKTLQMREISASSPLPRPSSAADQKRSAFSSQPAMFCSACGESCSSPESFQAHVMEKHRPSLPPSSSPTRKPFDSTSPPPPVDIASSTGGEDLGTNTVVNLAVGTRRSPSPKPTSTSSWNRSQDLHYGQQHGAALFHPATISAAPPRQPSQLSTMWPPRHPTFGEYIGINPLPGLPAHWHQDPAAMAWIASHHMMLPLTLAGQTHPHNYPIPQGHAAHGHGALSNGLQPRLYNPSNTATLESAMTEEPVFPCEICGKTFTAKEPLRQHMLLHAQPRPFVCEFCDAGFTTQKQLESHLILHRPRT